MVWKEYLQQSETFALKKEKQPVQGTLLLLCQLVTTDNHLGYPNNIF